MCTLLEAGLADCRDGVRPHAHAAHGVVCGCLAAHQPEVRRLRCGAPASPRAGLLPDRLGDAAPPARRDGAPRTGPPERGRRDGRDAPRGCDARQEGADARRKGAGGRRRRAPGAEGIRALPPRRSPRCLDVVSFGLPRRPRRTGLHRRHRRMAALRACAQGQLHPRSPRRTGRAGAQAAPWRPPRCQPPRPLAPRDPPRRRPSRAPVRVPRRSLEVDQGMRHVRGSPGLAVADSFS